MGGWVAVPADDTPAQQKKPLKPPHPNPPFFRFGFRGLSRVSEFREHPPPPRAPLHGDIPLATSTTVLSGLDFCAKCDFCVKGWVRGICMWRILWFWCFLMI